MVALGTEAWLRTYGDGPEWATTPALVEAERAYRRGFLEAARIAAKWHTPDLAMLEAAWARRRSVRSEAEVEENGTIYYRPDHAAAASEARGRVQAMEHVVQGWKELADRGMAPGVISTFVLPLWLQRVEAWAVKEINPSLVTIPPWPSHMLDEQQLAAVAGTTTTPAAPESPPAPVSPLAGLRSVRELLCMYKELRRPVIHGILREGESLNIISGSKVGKSWLAVDLAIAVATGGRWLDTFDTVRGPVLIVDNELHPETTAYRIPKVAAARNIPLEDFIDAVKVDNQRGRLTDLVAMEPYFAAIQPGQFRLIVLDALYRLYPVGMDESDNAALTGLYNRIDRHALRIGCSFVIVHHASKGNQAGKSVTDVGSGAGAQSRATDSHVVLRPHQEKDVAVLEGVVRSWPPVAPQCLRWQFPVWSPAPDLDPADLMPEHPRRQKKKDDAGAADSTKWTAQRFVESFVAAEPASKTVIVALAGEQGLSDRHASRLLAAAEAKKMVWRHVVPEDRRRAYYATGKPAAPEK